MVRKYPADFKASAELPGELNYEAEMKTTRVGPKKWVISIPIVLSDKFRITGSFKNKSQDAYKVKDTALKYVASERIKDLAQPKYRVDREPKTAEIIESPLSHVKTSALHYMPTKRIMQLARPKDVIHEVNIRG